MGDGHFMVVTIKWNFSLMIDGNQSLTIADKFETHAFGKISITIAKNTSEENPVTLELQPSDIEKIDFLCITSKSKQYDENIAYKVGNSEKEIKLNCAQVLIGSSLVGLLGESLTNLSFTNKANKDFEVEIIIGRRVINQGGS